ncbi:hypothetical protein Tco_0652038 [Tanacetum coccineum]|uniref:Uncharacterized protein n=1 Tax=Tanacetum coccineum TaxID=301880 RepID=A0ABQ4WWG6_9ASTR
MKWSFYSIFDSSKDDEDVGAEADINNLDTTIRVSLIPTTRIHKDHPLDQVIGDLKSSTSTRRMSKSLEEHGFVELDKVGKSLYGLHQAPKAWFTDVKTISTPIEIQKPLLKDENGEEIDVHMYRFQVNPKVSHLLVVKGMFRLLKKVNHNWPLYKIFSPFDFKVAYNDVIMLEQSLGLGRSTNQEICLQKLLMSLNVSAVKYN